MRHRSVGLLEAIDQQHNEMLHRTEHGNDNPIPAIEAFLQMLAQAGARVIEPEERSQLRSLIRFWAGELYTYTHSFPLVQLEPVNMALATSPESPEWDLPLGPV